MGKRCWNCKDRVSHEEFFCKSCGKIQENVEINEFEIFSIDKKVLIDLDLLEKNYLNLQIVFHPNKFIGLSQREIEASNNYSSKINESYNLLKNYVDRINLILEKSGVSIMNHDKTYKNSELLQDIMEIQEEFMFAEGNQKKIVKERIKKLIDKILFETEVLYKKRDYDQMLSFRDYETSTGHITFYYKEPRSKVLFKLIGGKYLAQDSGITIDLSREFYSGFQIGVFASKTDISKAEFGEGSFDKGFYWWMPVDLFFGDYRKQSTGWGLRPLTRDGAQRLVQGYPLWGVTDYADKNGIIDHWSDFYD